MSDALLMGRFERKWSEMKNEILFVKEIELFGRYGWEQVGPAFIQHVFDGSLIVNTGTGRTVIPAGNWRIA